jgi:rfaE bifunctional protein kinase chain/domain
MKGLISEERFFGIIERFRTLSPVAVVGDVGVDKYTYGNVRRISPEAPVPVLEVTKEYHKLGLAANISNNLKSLGMQSTLCGILGDDLNANFFIELMDEEGLNTTGLVRMPGRHTTLKERVITEVQQICRIDYESLGGIDLETENKILNNMEACIFAHDALIIEDYGKGAVTERLANKLTAIFKKAGKIVTVDPSRSTPPRFYKGVDLLKPNLTEARIMVQGLGYRETAVQKLAEILVEELKLNMLAITMGPDGMAIVDKKNNGGKLQIIPTVPTEVFDVSGAGDTAITVITAALMAGATLEEAAWIGNCASGVVVGKKGTATVNTEELSEFYKKMQKALL